MVHLYFSAYMEQFGNPNHFLVSAKSGVAVHSNNSSRTSLVDE